MASENIGKGVKRNAQLVEGVLFVVMERVVALSGPARPGTLSHTVGRSLGRWCWQLFRSYPGYQRRLLSRTY